MREEEIRIKISEIKRGSYVITPLNFTLRRIFLFTQLLSLIIASYCWFISDESFFDLVYSSSLFRWIILAFMMSSLTDDILIRRGRGQILALRIRLLFISKNNDMGKNKKSLSGASLFCAAMLQNPEE